MSARSFRVRTERLQADCATEEERVEAVVSNGPASCASPRWPLPAKMGCPIGSEEVRARLIGEISRIVREPVVPDTTRAAARELIGWLARRFPGETPHALGVEEAIRSRRPRASTDEEAPITERGTRRSEVAEAVDGSSQDAQSERRISVPRRRAR